MKILGRAAGFSRHGLGKQSLACLLSLALLFAGGPLSLSGSRRTRPGHPSPATERSGAALRTADSRAVAAASSTDCAVSRFAGGADPGGVHVPRASRRGRRWVQAHPDLKGEALGQAVDQQPWDPSVKALTAFPSVLGNMDKNLSWTSSLGRCLLQPATGCDGRGAGDAQESAKSRQS